MSERRKIVVPKKFKDKYADKDGKMQLWSYSKVSSIESCTWEYYLGRILKKESSSNSYAVLGSICHDLLEQFYNGKINYENLVETFEEKWLECELVGIKLYSDDEKNTKLMEEYKQDILNFFKTHRNLGNVLTEKEVWIDVEGNVFFGYVDAITKKDDIYYILDWKTSSLYKGDDIRKHQHQLLLYAMSLNQLGIPFDKIRIAWNFLKYIKINYNHMVSVTYDETVKDKTKQKTSTCYKDEWVSKIKTQLKKDIVSNFEKENLSNKEIKAMVDECVDNNSLKSLPNDISDKYVLSDVFKIERRHKYVSSMVTQLRKDLKRAGLDDISIEINITNCVDDNSLESLKDLIDLNNYTFDDAYVYGEISEQTISDLKKSLCENIEIIKSKNKDLISDWEREPIEDKEEFYCSVLCGQKKNCKYYKKHKEDKELFIQKTEGMTDDDLLNELLNTDDCDINL